MNGWFIALLLMHALNLGVHTAKHGEPKNDKYNIGSALFGSVIGILLIYMAIKTGF